MSKCLTEKEGKYFGRFIAVLTISKASKLVETICLKMERMQQNMDTICVLMND